MTYKTEIAFDGNSLVFTVCGKNCLHLKVDGPVNTSSIQFKLFLYPLQLSIRIFS